MLLRGGLGGERLGRNVLDWFCGKNGANQRRYCNPSVRRTGGWEVEAAISYLHAESDTIDNTVRSPHCSLAGLTLTARLAVPYLSMVTLKDVHGSTNLPCMGFLLRGSQRLIISLECLVCKINITRCGLNPTLSTRSRWKAHVSWKSKSVLFQTVAEYGSGNELLLLLHLCGFKTLILDSHRSKRERKRE